MRVDKGRNNKQRRLTADEIGYIKRAFEMNVSAIEVAKIFDLSKRCVRDRYQQLRGYALTPHNLEKGLLAKRKEGQPLGTRVIKAAQEAREIVRKAPSNPRFYRSDFIPS